LGKGRKIVSEVFLSTAEHLFAQSFMNADE